MELRPPVEPMLAAPTDTLPEGRAMRGGCLYEPKFDGYRALLFVTAEGVVVQSRRGADITSGFPDIAAAAALQLPAGTVLDGELVVLGDSGVLAFSELQRRLGAGVRKARALAAERPASFIAFDLLAHDASTTMEQPLRRRRALLEDLLADVVPPLQAAPQTDDVEVARDWLRQYASVPVGLEGVVVKGAADRYRPGQRGWMKVRVRNTHEVVLGAVTGTLERPERLVLGRYDPAGDLVVVGGTADLKPAQSEELRPLLEPPTLEHPWPTELPAGRMGRFGGGTVEVTLVQPLVVEVSADQSFEYGKWRHLARFVRPRPDLGPAEVPTVEPTDGR